MEENCRCGSVRGALGNRRPYRDSEVYDRRDVWVGLKPTARLRASRSRQGREERQLRKRKTKTLLSDWRSLPKKCLTGPTLLEMSGYPTNRPSRICEEKCKCATEENPTAHWAIRPALGAVGG